MGAKGFKTFILNHVDKDIVLEHLTAFGWELMEIKDTEKYNADLPKQGGLRYYFEIYPPFLLMAMSRDFNLKNIDELTKLEKEYYVIKWPKKPGFIGRLLGESDRFK